MLFYILKIDPVNRISTFSVKILFFGLLFDKTFILPFIFPEESF